MKLLATLNLDDKYVRHDVPIYCHAHPTQQDVFNAAVKALLSALQDTEWVDCAGEQVTSIGTKNIAFESGEVMIEVTEIENPVTIGTLKIRDNSGVLELSDDNGLTWQEVGSGGALGDMSKSVYDPDDNGRVQVSETVSNGVITILASEIDGHLNDTTIHFMQDEIDHTQIGARGMYSHDDIDIHLQDNVFHIPFPVVPVPISGISFPFAIINYGAVCVGYTDIQTNPLILKISQDGDDAWRGTWASPRNIYIAYYDGAQGDILIQYFDGAGVQQQSVLAMTNYGDWIGAKIQVEMRCNGEFPGGGDLKITAGSALPFYLSGLRLKFPGDQVSFAEWRAVL